MSITTTDIIERLRRTGLNRAAAEAITRSLWEIIGRELAVGETIEVPNLGRFLTVKRPAHREQDGGISLPTVEPDFEPDSYLVRHIGSAIKRHPELFASSKADEAEEDDDDTAEEKDDKAAPQSADLKDREDTTTKKASEEVSAPASSEPKEEKEVAPPSADVPVPAKPERPLGRASTIRYLDLSRLKVDREVLSLLPLPLAKKYRAVPVELKEGVLTVAMIDPEDYDTIQFISKETGLTVEPVLTSQDDLNGIYDQYTGLQAELEEVLEHGDFGITKKEISAAQNENVLEETDENAPTAKIVGSLLKRAVKERASDVHIEPYEHKVVARFRLDGILTPRVELPKEIQSAIVARLKILANLKIDEQRLPQDGRFTLVLDHREVDFRLSTIPVVYGEKIVMRILDKKQGIRELEEVGMTGQALALLQNNIKRSHGMILVTGPTGSGKTTTLYAVLARLMSPDVNIITLEDPVEYRIESINQSQVHTEIGYGFANGLRAIVRQDPDIVMLGEIRDTETAEMAVQAALTGHVVLSTLHTNDAAGAFPRLIDMQVEPFLITSSVHTVIAQRLARLLDQETKVERELSTAELEEVLAVIETLPESLREQLEKEGINLKKPVVYEPKASESSNGYRGRIGIFEVLDVTEEIRDLVLKHSSGSDIKEVAVRKNGMVTMIQDGIVKALRGQTSLEEVWRVTRE